MTEKERLEAVESMIKKCRKTMTNELSLSEDAFVFGDGVMKKKETVAIEKKVYEVRQWKTSRQSRLCGLSLILL